MLARFVAMVGDKWLDQVATFDVETWKTTRAKQVRKSTVNRELNIVRGCFSRAVEWERVARSPMATVKPFRVENTRLRVLSPDEINMVLTEAPQDLALMARVTLEGLLRVSEVLSLMRSDIQRDYLVVAHTKNNKVRKVPISSDLRRALLARTHQSGYVFGETRYQGHPATQSTVTQAFRRVMARLGIANASHHTLRHTGASSMLADGISVRVVQEIGGWRSLRMLERYTHPTDAETRRAVESASRLTRVGTKTGTKSISLKQSERRGALKWMQAGKLERHPQGTFTYVDVENK